jgi:hypothetical protein
LQHNHSTTIQHIIEQQKLPDQGMVKDHLVCCLVKIMFLKEGQPMLHEECDNVAKGKYIPKKYYLLEGNVASLGNTINDPQSLPRPNCMWKTIFLLSK